MSSDKKQRASAQADGEAQSDAALSEQDLEQVSGGQTLLPQEPGAPPPFIGDWPDTDLTIGAP